MRIPIPAAPLAAEKKGQRGFVLIFALMMLMGISTLGIGMLYNARHGQVASQNYKNRIQAFYASDGIRSLLAQEILDGKVKRYMDTSQSGTIDGDVWEGINGNTLAPLVAVKNGTPTRHVTSDYLGSNFGSGKLNYGVIWKGYVVPPATGNYTFSVRSDDASAFYLSTDELPSNLRGSAVAYLDSYVVGWPMSGTGISNPIALKSGKKYYFEYYHKQGTGEGYGQVGWKSSGFVNERPIPGKRLASVGSTASKWDTTRVSGRKVKYSVAEAGALVYSLNTEAVMGGAGDTTFHAPLQQILSMRGESTAPPDSLWARVIYYDFRTNGSNPDFERGTDFFSGVVTPGMVREKGLKYDTTNARFFGRDSIGKPILKNPKYNCGVDKWFTPWTSGWNYTYSYAGGSWDCTPSAYAGGKAFDNKVFKDSLKFLRRADLGANVYQFSRFGAKDVPAFVPLDGKGFGDEMGLGHNFSFCMEMHSQFEHTSGMNFSFNGDDDVWLYINDSLVLDMGFVHWSTYQSINLDDLDLKFGNTYNLDFFYCERQSKGSSIDIVSNLPILQAVGKPISSWRRDYGNTE